MKQYRVFWNFGRILGIEGRSTSRRQLESHKNNFPAKRPSWYIDKEAITESVFPTE